MELPAETAETERYFRDVHDHLIRLSEQLEPPPRRDDGGDRRVPLVVVEPAQRGDEDDAVVATATLPLTFVTGFFGQNFPWMVDHVGGPWAFLVLGIGSQLAVVLVLVIRFRRRGWF